MKHCFAFMTDMGNLSETLHCLQKPKEIHLVSPHRDKGNKIDLNKIFI